MVRGGVAFYSPCCHYPHNQTLRVDYRTVAVDSTVQGCTESSYCTYSMYILYQGVGEKQCLQVGLALINTDLHGSALIDTG